jgi:polyhydroxyalkanoate synthesis regulator phasin
MNEFLKKMVDLQLGLITVTKDKVKEVVDELQKTGKVSKWDGKKWADDLTKKGEKAREEITDYINEKINIPTRKEFEDLKKEIAELKKELKKKC